MAAGYALVFLLVAAALASAAAQERIPAGPPPGGPTFEVASIKRVPSGDIRTSASVGDRPGGVFVLSNMAIAPMIRTAYPADTSELIAAPDWVSSERYDVTAKAAGDVPDEQMEAMLRALLAERFKLAVHYEIQERPVYALVPARADGRLGPNIRRSDLDCEAIRNARRAGSQEQIPQPKNGAPACGMSTRSAQDTEVLLGGMPLTTLTSSFGSATGRFVVDKTGLKGNYEVTLRYNPQPRADAPPEAAPSIFTAVEEQLGLKLQADRAPLRILVIDHIERPTEN